MIILSILFKMTRDEVLQKIKYERPRIIYISGKTSTGKTTLSKDLKNFFGYSVIELGSIVSESVIKPFSADPVEVFITVYRDTEPKKYTSAFIKATRKAIVSQLKYSPVVVEGAIAKTRILKEIFSGELEDFMFIYLDPVEPRKYAERIQQRFVAGAVNNTTELPKSFWKLIDNRELEEFTKTKELTLNLLKSIDQYVALSMEESRERLKHFQENFSKINIIEV